MVFFSKIWSYTLPPTIRFGRVDKFDAQGMKKHWYDWLIKQTMPKEKKPKIIREKLKDEIINGIWMRFQAEKEKRDRKKS